MKSPDDSTPSGVKLLAAVLGTSAVLAMGALTVAVGGNAGASEPPDTTLGETTTETTAPSELETPFATPPITSTEEEG